MFDASDRADVVVIGAGCAGLAAASALAEAGMRVVVIEQAPRLGGRASAFTDPATGERVDNGQHVLFGCYRQTYKMLRRLGTEHFAPLQPRLALAMVGPDGRRFDLRCPRLPPPLHLLVGVLTWRALSWTDRRSILRIGKTLSYAAEFGPAVLAADVPEHQTVDAWLQAAGQTKRLCDWLWHPLTLAALNQPAHVAAARPFVRVLGELFGPRKEDAAVGLSTVPLDELYAEPARRFVETRGGSVHTGESATVVIDDGRVIGVRTPRRSIATKLVVSAVPWYAFDSIWEPSVPAALETIAANARRMRPSPIVTVNLWLDGPTIDVPFVGLVDNDVHWVFDKRQIVGGRANHLALVTSGADRFVEAENKIVTAAACEALRPVLSTPRRVTRSVVVRERRATFSLAPGGPPRPGTVTSLPGFYIAGDWTDTGLPATIEGAVLSGHAAAARALKG
jgi:squalene-associated FAD-dependent desaturase